MKTSDTRSPVLGENIANQPMEAWRRPVLPEPSFKESLRGSKKLEVGQMEWLWTTELSPLDTDGQWINQTNWALASFIVNCSLQGIHYVRLFQRDWLVSRLVFGFNQAFNWIWDILSAMLRVGFKGVKNDDNRNGEPETETLLPTTSNQK